VNQLLTEMDGLDGRKQVYVIGATNRPGFLSFFFLLSSFSFLYLNSIKNEL